MARRCGALGTRADWDAGAGCLVIGIEPAAA
jgi:hypothetical protein